MGSAATFIYETLRTNMQLVLYSQHVRRVSGLFTFELNFCKVMSKYHDITFVYESIDVERQRQIEQYAKPVKNDGQRFDCDICIYSSVKNTNPEPRIFAQKYIQVCHCDYKAWNVNYKPNPKVTIHVGVGEVVTKSLIEQFGAQCVTIPNMLDPEFKPEKVLRLVTASRIEKGKGFERMIDLAKKMRIAGKRFVWEVYGDGSYSYLNELKYKLNNVPDIVFMGARMDVQHYMKDVDYVVQLSDSEGFCYSIFEAFQVGTPVIVSRWEGVESSVIEGQNGYILDMDLGNLDIDKLFNNIPQDVKLDLESTEQLWKDLLSQ